MGRARLWEETLIIALRDWQWLHHQSQTSKQVSPSARRPMPPGLVKLDGNAESRIGDVVTALPNARFFIFEVKSERARVRDEWVRRGAYRPKLVYERLKGLVKACNDSNLLPRQRQGDEQFLNLWRSISCHHFLYWSGIEEQDRLVGHPRLEPYIWGAIANRTVHDKTVSETMRPLLLTKPPKILDGDDPVSKVWLDYFDRARINTPKNPSEASEPLGLLAEEFEAYLRFLCGGQSGSNDFQQWTGAAEDVHIVVLSSGGGFFRVFTDTNQLVSLIDGHYRDEPSPQRDLEAEHPQARNRPS